MQEIDIAIVINVVNIVCGITFVLISVYPIIYIIRSMVEFVSKCFSNIKIDKVLHVPTINLGQNQKPKWEREM